MPNTPASVESSRMDFNGRPNCFIRTAALLFFVYGFGLATPLRAQKLDNDPAFKDAPFEKWLAEGPREELRWKTRIGPTELSSHERMLADIEVQIDGREILKRCCEGRAVSLMQITDGQGRAYQDHGIVELKDVKPGAKQYLVNFEFQAFVLPGDYRVVLAFYYSGKEGHSLALHALHVSPLKNDPLADAWSGLPTVEFLDSGSQGADEFFRPEITSRLHLPVAARRPLSINLLVNMTPYRTEQIGLAQYKYKLAAFLPILKTFAQMDVRNGSLDLATLDFTRRRVTFEQKDLKDRGLDWAGLKQALAANDPSIVNVGDLGIGADQYAVFFGEEMLRRLEASDHEGDSPGERPLQVIILVSSPMAFGFANRPSPIGPPQKTEFVVYYLRCRYWPTHVPTGDGFEVVGQIDDGIEKILKNLKPRIFAVKSPQDLRSVLASVLAELSKM